MTLTPAAEWTKRPFPIPDVLLTPEGKFRGEVYLTVAYAPPVNPAFGAEAVRYDVAGSFGAIRVVNGKEKFSTITPQHKAPGASYWEKDQIADGKWAPVKTYFGRYVQGVQGGTWALRLTLTERVTNEINKEQRAYAIITFRAIEPGVDVYNSGIDAIARLNYDSTSMVPVDRIRVQGT